MTVSAVMVVLLLHFVALAVRARPAKRLRERATILESECRLFLERKNVRYEIRYCVAVMRIRP